MNRWTGPLAMAMAVAGCASAPQLTPWRADALLGALPPTCARPDAPPDTQPVADTVVPGGLSVVRSEGRRVIVVAASSCVMVVDATTGAVEPLPTRGDSIAPTMVDVSSNGVAFTSSNSGSVRAIDTEGAVTFNFSGLREPLGVRLLPGGSALVAEFGAGRILRLGPTAESRPRIVADKLTGPVALAVVDATQGYVSEYLAGRISLFRLDRFETTKVVDGLDRPEGIALLPDGRIAVVEAGLRRLVAVDPETRRIEVMVDNLPIGLESARGPRDPFAVTDVVAAPDGAIFVSSDIDRTILSIAPRPSEAGAK